MQSIDPTTLAGAFDALAAPLFLYARQWLGAHAAEDVIQESFLRLAAQKETPRNVKGWMFATVRHAALDAIKMEKRRSERDRRAGEARGAMFLPDPAAPVMAEEIQKALAALSAEVREVVVLRVWTDSTFQEIAALTELPLSTIYHHYKTGLETLRNKWESPCKT